jgi:flagellar hook-associated protein 3 FlgL
MRVSHRNIYANVLNYMNRSLSGLVELNLQASSQKKINRPSDDPIGMSRVLSYRDSMASMTQYRKNIDTAQGWNGLADENLMQVSVVISRLKELAQQAATGTYTGDNREQISYEARQLYEQLIMLSNASFEGKHIYSGHKVDTPAFRQALFAQSNGNGGLDGNIVRVEGGTSATALVQFLETDDILNTPDFRYSTDGGKTWKNGTYDPAPPSPPANTQVLVMGGVRVTLNDAANVVATDGSNYNDTSGTWLWVRPSAVYQGDDEDNVNIERFVANAGVDSSAQGVFSRNVMVRIDDNTGPVVFSYSVNGGKTWVEENTAPLAAPTSLPIPGGFLNLSDGADPPGNPPLTNGDQFVIRPNRALMHVEISQSETIQINNIGKEVFGGLYPDVASGFNQPVDLHGTPSKNLFETVGKLIGYLETNTQQGAQEALDDLNEAHAHITSYLAGVGARRNRLDLTDNILSGLELNATERKSKIEDVDVAELMTQMHMQQITYEAVLKSSTTIMRMSLVNMM